MFESHSRRDWLLLVPTLCVGMPSSTLCVLFAGPEDSRFERRQPRTTQSIGDCIPTQSVGTSVSIGYSPRRWLHARA
jgi:hypothetical protein